MNCKMIIRPIANDVDIGNFLLIETIEWEIR